MTVPPAKRRTAREDELYQQVIVRVPAQMHDAIKRCAETEERTMSQVVRRALRRYLEAEEAAA